MLHIAFLNVGQGDTTVVCNPQTHEAIVVDCLNPVAVWDLLQRENVHRVRAVVVTHLHRDHYAGLITFLEGCEPRNIDWDAVYFYWLPQIAQREQLLDDDDGHSQGEDILALQQKKKLDTYRTLAVWIGEPGNERRYRLPDRLDEVNVQGMVFELLHPTPSKIGRLALSGKLNNLSIVLRVSSGEASVLLTGDLEPDGWDVLMENMLDLSSDVLKFPHHGAWKRDDVDALLDQVRPEIVIMSVGTVGHQYEHPNSHVFDALKRRVEIKVLCTQATKKCTPEPDKAQDRVQALLASIENKFTGVATNKGCPCASTVIVELGERAQIIHPPRDTHFHIIAQCFPLAQCRKSA
jgi:competence protein ComEC